MSLLRSGWLCCQGESVTVEPHSVSWHTPPQGEGPTARQVFLPSDLLLWQEEVWCFFQVWDTGNYTFAMSKIRVLGYSPVWDLIMCCDSEFNYTPCCIVLDGGWMRK